MLYDRYTKKYIQHNTYDIVSKYLLDEVPSDGRDIIWIYIDENINARKWMHWGSRNTLSMNQPYIHLTLKSIIEQANGKFKVCLLDDHSFAKLLPDFSIQLSSVPEPSKSCIRNIAMLKIVHHYGGIIIPMSYIACNPVEQLYSHLNTAELFICKTPQPEVNCMQEQFYFDITFMGAKKQSILLAEIIEQLEHVYSNDFTEEKVLLHKVSNIIQPYSNRIITILPHVIGCQDRNHQPITLEQLFSEQPIEFSENMHGLLIPYKEILSTSKYNWFSALPINDIYHVKNNISKLLQTH